MTNERLRSTLLWTVAFIAVAITIAAGVRIVDWITEGETSGVWKVALALIGAAAGGGSAASAIQKTLHSDDDEKEDVTTAHISELPEATGEAP